MKRTLGFAAALLAMLAGSPAAPAAPDPAKIEVDRVEVTGVTVFPTQEIEAALEISPGDALERAKIIRTAENLEALYRIHGYEQVTITSKLHRRKGKAGAVESAIEFLVVEGKPTRVSEIRFSSLGLKGDAFRKYWDDLGPELLKRGGIAKGDILDQEKVTRGRRAVQDFLASEEFVGAKVTDVRIAHSAAPAADSGNKKLTEGLANAARWVSVEFQVELGDRVTFGFRGNSEFTSSRLHSLIDEQRLLGFGSDYVESVRLRIVEEYRAAGYGNAVVTPYMIERADRHERHVTFAIQEGAKLAIASVTFDGNSVFSTEDLRERFFARASPLIQHGYYSEKDVTRAAELTIEGMRADGYLSAKLVTINTLPVSRARARNYGPAYHLVIYLYEGEQTLVEGIRITGAKAIPPQEVSQILGVSEGQPLNLFAFSEGIEVLKTAYRARGFLGMQITNESTDRVVKYTDENRLASIDLEIDEGPMYRASRIVIEGLGRTREEIVRRELAFKEGDVLEEPLIIQSEQSLRKLGVFSLVTIRVTEDAEREGHKVVRVAVQEAIPGIVAGGVGFRNDLGIRVFGQTAYTNLMGRNHTISLSAAVNRRFVDYRFVEYAAQLDYLWPWFVFGDTTFRPAFGLSATQYRSFDATTASMYLSWEKKLIRRPELAATLTYSLEQISQKNASFAADNQDLTIGAITPGIRLDTRDNPLSPTRGWYSAASLEIASPYLGSQVNPFPIGYGRFQLRTDKFIPLGDATTLYLSFRTGFERSTQNPTDIEGSGAIPLIKQFALGGAGSLRGFRDQEISRRETSVRGTLSYTNYRAQIDLPLAGALRFGPFLDAGNLFLDRLPFGELRYGAGGGFHYQTPVGPVNLDIGFKLFPRPDENPYQIYFSVGVI